MVAESGRWGTFRTIWPADGAGDGRAGCLTEDRRRRRVLPPDRGRWWQKVADGGLFAQFGPQTEPAMAALAVSPRIGDGGEFCPQIGADGGRKWQMGDFSHNLARRRSRRWPRWLSHRGSATEASSAPR